jgi:hypothetical protein
MGMPLQFGITGDGISGTSSLALRRDGNAAAIAS